MTALQAARGAAAAFGLLLAAAAPAQESADPSDAVAQAREAPIDCKHPDSFNPLFELSASGTVADADASEALTRANEDAFLKCPFGFLAALTSQSRETQDGVLGYFGTQHPAWELGAELRKWKNHPQVGPLVRGRLAAFLDARPPK